MKRFLLALSLSFALISCSDRIASPGDTAPPSAVQQAADRIVIEGTRALILAELSYESVANVALELVNAGVIKGERAAQVQAANRVITDLLVKAKAATNAAARATLVAKALDETFKLEVLTMGARP